LSFLHLQPQLYKPSHLIASGYKLRSKPKSEKQLLPLKTPAALSAQLRFEANAKASFALGLLNKSDTGAMERGRSFVVNKQNAEGRAAASAAGQRDYYSSANSNLGAARCAQVGQSHPIAQLELD
jgi:hypothetical protein